MDLAAWACPENRCIEEIDGTILRDDGLHFDGDGGLLAARRLLEEVQTNKRG